MAAARHRGRTVTSAIQLREWLRLAEAGAIVLGAGQGERYRASLAEIEQGAVEQPALVLPAVAEVASTPAVVKTLRVHPGLASAVLRADAAMGKGERRQHATGYYLWTLARLANTPAGNGWIAVDVLHAFCADVAGMGDKKFSRYLADAESIGFIEVVERRIGDDVVRMRSLEHVARILGCESVGWPVEIELGERRTGSIGKWRSSLLASWHAGRRSSSPVSQVALTHITGVKARRQHTYNARAGVKVHHSYSESNIKAAHLDGVRLAHPAAFVREGVIVWPLPSQYTSPLRRAPKLGMARNVDRVLPSAGVWMSRTLSSSNGGASCDTHQRELVGEGASGRVGRRRYFGTQKGAARAWQRSDYDGEFYYRAVVTGRGKSARRNERRTRDGSLLWGYIGPTW